MSIDLGNNPVGTPPTDIQSAQIRSVLGCVENAGGANAIQVITQAEYDDPGFTPDSNTIYVITN